MAERGDAGFSLIEALVALAILAISAISLLAAAEAHVGRIASLERRTLARFAAENRIAELELGRPDDADTVEMLGQVFTVSVTRNPTRDPDLERLDLTVTDAQAESFGGFTAFLARKPAE